MRKLLFGFLGLLGLFVSLGAEITSAQAQQVNLNCYFGPTNTQWAPCFTNATPTDCSGAIASGGTAQVAFGPLSNIHGFTIANINSTTGSGEPLWLSFTGTATASTAGSYPLSAPTATTFAGLSSFTSPLGFALNHALSVVAATSGHKYSCTYW